MFGRIKLLLSDFQKLCLFLEKLSHRAITQKYMNKIYEDAR